MEILQNVFKGRYAMHNINLLLSGLLVGSLLCNLISISYLRKYCGILRIDHSNPEKDVYRFDIDDIDSLSNKKRIVLKIDNNADLSQN